LVRAEGPVLVVGGSGYGKSLLAELVIEAIYPRLDVVSLQSAQLCSRRALLQNILFTLQLPYRELSEGELRLSILDRLEPSPETAPDGILIVVDEAQTLHWKLIDELRLLSNYTRNNQPRVRLLLLGNMRLEDTLASPQLESLNQRLAARCYLQPMSRSETQEFIKHQLLQVGMQPSTTITQDALQAVFAASQGIPRLVNQIMDHALVLANAQAQLPISTALISETWADLQQLPAPWTDNKPETDSQSFTSTIEIGILTDEDQDALAAPPPTVELVANQPEELAELFPIDSYNRDPDDRLLESSTKEATCRELPKAEPNFFSAFVVDESVSWCHPDEATSVPSDASVRQESDTAAQSIDAHSEPSESRDTGQPEISCQCEQATNSIAHSALTQTAQIWQAAIESTGSADTDMWEDDPPLRSQTKSLFGDDFDQEIEVPHSGETAAEKSTFPSIAKNEYCSRDLPALTLSSNQLESKDTIKPESPSDYLQRLQCYADAITQLNHSSGESLDSSEARANAESTGSCTASEPWTFDIGSQVASVPGLEESIEDIVSHLNFSALTTQPFSVEQIELSASPEATISEETGFRITRQGQLSDQYPSIRYSQPERFALTPGECDDDRDLLIIEEEIPTGNRLLEANLSHETPKRLNPYSQLFAKLRK
jgi:type II secretory pathway predicted ATPase ExeA